MVYGLFIITWGPYNPFQRYLQLPEHCGKIQHNGPLVYAYGGWCARNSHSMLDV